MTTKQQHTPGAIRAAEIIMDQRQTLSTLYGVKSAEGIADLIDRETHAPDLAEALREIAEASATTIEHAQAIRDCARALLAKIEGK
jgi:hypothetical protein